MCFSKRCWSPVAKQTWVVSAVLINKFGQGLVMGMMSAMISALKTPDSEIKITLDTGSWLVSMLPISTLFGFPIVSLLMNKFGRKAAYCIKNIPAIIGLILAAYGTSITALMISRILCGLTTGSTAILGAMVVGEFTSPQYRGMFLSLKTAFFNIGCLSIHILTNYIDWRTASLVSTVPFMMSILVAFTWPESPSWLAEQKEFQKSIDTFYWLRGKSEETTREIEEIINKHEFKSPPKTFYKSVVEFLKKFNKRNFLKPFIVTIFTSVILECSGRHIFPSYAAVLIEVPLTLVGEIFPLEHRAVGTLVSGFIFGAVFSIALKITPYLLAAFNTYGAFAIFAEGLACALLVLYFILPETKDKTLQDIEYFFVHGKYRVKEKLSNEDKEANTKMMGEGQV